MSSKSKARTVILISGRGSNMLSLVQAAQAGRCHIDVQAVISNRPQAAGLSAAAEQGIATEIVDHTLFDSREAFDTALAEAIDQYQPALVILAGFMRILTPDFTRHYAGHMLNIHPSLLPKYPGLNTHQRAIDAGDTEHGASIHFVTAELDGGPVALQSVVPVLTDDNADTLAERVLQTEHQLYIAAADWYGKGLLRFVSDRTEQVVLCERIREQPVIVKDGQLHGVEPTWQNELQQSLG